MAFRNCFSNSLAVRSVSGALSNITICTTPNILSRPERTFHREGAKKTAEYAEKKRHGFHGLSHAISRAISASTLKHESVESVKCVAAFAFFCGPLRLRGVLLFWLRLRCPVRHWRPNLLGAQSSGEIARSCLELWPT